MRRSQRIRLARVLGMLGSDHAGERASAALAADRLVKAAGTTWWQLLSPTAGAAGPVPRDSRWVDAFHDPVAAANARMRQLRAENALLEAEVKRLKRLLDARRAPPGRGD
ncbi:MAG TPA: hypothetical protein VEB20_20600 [Azospirillaceae bacterium]|nr:hypothetical protein [Azospirillaceae bacterium]